MWPKMSDKLQEKLILKRIICPATGVIYNCALGDNYKVACGLIIATLLKGIRISVFLNQFKHILHENMQPQSSTIFEVPKTLMVSVIALAGATLFFPYISAANAMLRLRWKIVVIFICGIFSPAFMEVIGFLSHTSASGLPILLFLVVSVGKNPIQATSRN